MTELVFKTAIDRLRKFYGEKALPLERQKMIAREMKSLSDEQFVYVVDEIIAHCNNTPTLKEFKKYSEGFIDGNNIEREKLFQMQLAKRKEQGLACKTCDDFGIVYTISKKNKHTSSYAFGCPEDLCNAREYLARGTTKWGADQVDNFELIKRTETTMQAWERVWNITD